ncbi:DUF3500 domain-containing protein [Rathayibacter oskolensis]|uniref:DUF3500 domain-containing protein n=1 Tax=Rathayibacter oskolensis TaxID=1891671 RepID=UPI003467606E
MYAHRSETYFQWIGGTGSTDPFYFRIHSPVVWIEFDCETPGPIGQGWGAADTPSRQHIHSDVRTPNGNDYGRSLLALHLALDH